MHSDKDHQMLFVGGPKSRKTNSIWLTAAILNKMKKLYLHNGRGGELVDVSDVCVTCGGEGGLGRSEQLAGYFYSALPL